MWKTAMKFTIAGDTDHLFVYTKTSSITRCLRDVFDWRIVLKQANKYRKIWNDEFPVKKEENMA